MILDAMLYSLALAYLATVVLLVLWLGWAGLMAAQGGGEEPVQARPQLIVLGVLLVLGVGVWFGFGLAGALAFDRPVMLWLLLLILPIFLLGRWSLQQLGPARRWVSVFLRVVVLMLLVSILAGFRTVQTHDELTVVMLIDHSESVRRYYQPPADKAGQSQDLEQWLSGYVAEAADGKPSQDYWAVQRFDGQPTVVMSPSLGSPTLPLGTIDEPLDGSNGQRAIESGMAAKHQPDSALRMVLVSDGNLDGEVMAAVQGTAAAGVQIDVLPLRYQVQGEVMVEAVRATPEAREGQTVKVSVELRATDPIGGMLQLKHNNIWVDLNGPAEGIGLPIDASEWRSRLDSGTGETGLYALTKYIDRTIDQPGVNTYEAVFVPQQGSSTAEPITANDRGQAFTLVAGQGKVLVVDGVGGPSGMILPRSLAERGIDVDVAPVTAMPSRLIEMREYDAILLHNVPAENVPPKVQRNLTRYVHDMGGGFAMIGGPDSFGPGGWTNTDIDKYILPVSCRIPSQRVLPSGALILLIDCTGSMFGAKGHVAEEAAILALKTLYPQDMVGVITFGTKTEWLHPLQMNADPNGTANKIRAMNQGGGTDIDTGLDMAHKAMEDLTMQDAAVKHVLLVTDGWEEVRNPIATAGRYNKAGISLTTIGVDQNNRQLLEGLAQMCNGTYYSVIDPKKLPQVFIKEARLIRKNLIKEGEFTPRLRAVGSPVMVGIGEVPPLRGFVLTAPKQDPRIFTPIVGAEGEPIFAHHQVGLGRSAAFTADASNRWAQDWLGDWGGSSNYADFWARTVRLIARPNASTQADLSTTIEGGTMTLRLDAAGDVNFAADASRASFGNNLTVKGSVAGPNDEVVQVELEQVGPGVYETRLPANPAGNYIVDVQMLGEDGERRRVIGGASKPAGKELRDFTSNLATLQQIAEMTGGRVLDPDDPSATNLYRRDESIQSTSTRPLRWQLMPFLLSLLLLDVASRRIAWEGREVAGWAKARAGGLLGMVQTHRGDAGTTMAALKAKREELSQHTEDPEPLVGLAARVKAQGDGRPTKKPKPNPTTSKTRKFVASEEELAAAQEDFSAAVGGAQEGQQAKPIVTAAMKKSEKQQDLGPTTSRLLDAKKRAQQRMDEKDG